MSIVLRFLMQPAGIGCESIMLAKKGGYKVTCNESSQPLLDIASNAADSIGLDERRITFTNGNCTMMSFEFNREEFDAVLLLGSALARFLDYNDRKRCLDQFFEILKPGGILIIDERNLTRILDSKDEVIGDREKFYESYSGDYMYCGTEVKGWPHRLDHRVDGDVVTFRYSRKDNPDRIAEIPLFVFKKGELEDMLKARFEKIDIYPNLDFEQNSNIKTDPLKIDFYTYVAHKPRKRI